MSEASHAVVDTACPDLLDGYEIVTLNNYLGNHEAQLAVAGIFAVLPDITMPKLRIMKELLIRQVPTLGNPTAADHKIRVEESGGWVPHEGVPAKWCIWSLEPAGLLEQKEYQGRKGPQPAWRATELAVRALPYVGGLAEWSLSYPDISLQQTAGGTPSNSDADTRAPQLRHAIYRRLLDADDKNPPTYKELESAVAAENIVADHVTNTIVALSDQGLLAKNPPNFNGLTTVFITDEHKKPIQDLIQTIDDVATEDGAEFYSDRAQEILDDPEQFLPLIAKAKRFSSSYAGTMETHAGTQQRIAEALRTIGAAEAGDIYQHLNSHGRTVSRRTIYTVMRELVKDGTVESFRPGTEHAIGDFATTFTLSSR
jgi:hypothetical protein